MKNQFILSISLLFSAITMAQLTVKPTNAGDDSYIFVKDQILFVDNTINLTKNADNSDTEASIYLRGDAQLIQKETTSTNTGTGFLSVQQESPKTNKWAYYYWCSPVGNPLASGTSVGTNKHFGVASIYESLSGLTGTEATQALTTTAREGEVSPLKISTRWLYTLMEPGTETEGNYMRMNSDNAAPAGFGFTMMGVGELSHDTQLYEFRGRPNNGNFEIPVQGPAHTGGGGNVDARMTLTGNPYPSALDLNRVFYDPENGALSAFYFYDEDRTVASYNYADKPFGYGVYVPGDPDPDGNPGLGNFQPGTYVDAPFFIWNASGGSTSTGNFGNQVLSHRFAPIGQGIMFVGTDPNNTESVYIKNAHRRYIPEGQFFHSVFHKPESIQNKSEDQNTTNKNTSPIDASIIHADLRMPQTRIYAVFNKKMTRDLLLTFSNQSTDGFDRGKDGLSPMGLTTDAYFPVGPDSNRLPYVINSVKYDLEKQIPITFKVKNETTIDLQIVEEVKRPYKQIYLFDSEENTYKNISTDANKPISINLPAGTYEGRFFIVFKSPFIKKDDPLYIEAENIVLKNIHFFQNNPANQLEVKNPEKYTIKSASVYDMGGKLIISETNLGDDSTFTFYTGNLSNGVYLVKLITSEDISVDYKVVVKN